jgi:hypothetical protein
VKTLLSRDLPNSCAQAPAGRDATAGWPGTMACDVGLVGARRVRRGSAPSARRADAFVGAGWDVATLETSADHLLLPGGGAKGRARKA